MARIVFLVLNDCPVRFSLPETEWYLRSQFSFWGSVGLRLVRPVPLGFVWQPQVDRQAGSLSFSLGCARPVGKCSLRRTFLRSESLCRWISVFLWMFVVCPVCVGIVLFVVFRFGVLFLGVLCVTVGVLSREMLFVGGGLFVSYCVRPNRGMSGSCLGFQVHRP